MTAAVAAVPIEPVPPPPADPAAALPPHLASPEAALLLRAARIDDGIAATGIDWPRLFVLARRHRMIPLLHRHLREVHLPADAASELRARQADELRRTLRLTGEMRRLIGMLEDEGIPALAYKGPALAMRAYGDLSLRGFVDLDLLARPADIPRAVPILAAAGYRPEWEMTPAQERFFRRVDGDYPMLHDDGTLLELHARVSSLRFGIPIDTDALMRRAQTVALGGGAVRTMGDDDLLLVLFVHGAKHRWKRLEWLAAIAAMLRAGHGDVDAVLRHASILRGRRTVLLGLHLVHVLLGVDLPIDIIHAIRGDGEIATRSIEVMERLFGPRPDDAADTRANLRFNLRLRDGAMDRARYVAGWLFGPTPEDWRWKRIPDALFPLYRVLRPVRLLGRHGAGGG